MTREVYIKKPNGRYESLGQDWTGFPANGIWLVQDGKQNCLIQLKDICKKPKRYLELAEFEDECTEYVQEKSKEQGNYSLRDISRWAAEFYSQHLGT